jgi:2-hydroxycyclohexanecarboxyl-CoA dehydrogenase
MEFAGMTVLVTGGASGIGKATVTQLLREGASVICADIDQTKGKALVEEGRASGSAIDYEPIDLTDNDSVRRCAAAVLARHSRIDVLINGAGFGDFHLFVDTPPNYLDKVIRGNLTGALHLTQALLPQMIANRRGKIINVSSDAGRVGSTGETAYAAAKGGLIAFTKSLAREMARHNINAFIKAIAFRRLGKPEEIADAIIFFASRKSDYITGQVLSVSGGLTFAG